MRRMKALSGLRRLLGAALLAMVLVLAGAACESSGGGEADVPVGGDISGGADVAVGPDVANVEDVVVATQSVEVTYDGATQMVALGDLATTEVDGTDMVRLSDVVAAAFPALALSDVKVFFEASDGFRPGTEDRCTDTAPVDGAVLTQGYIDPVTRDLAWDAELGFPNCIHVGDVVLIELFVPVVGASVDVSFGGTTETVALGELATTDVEGAPMVALSTVVAAAFPAVVLADVTADFEASDGYRPANSGNCVGVTPVDGTALTQGYIDPTTRDLAWADALDFPGCMGLDDTALIELVAKVTRLSVDVSYDGTTESVALWEMTTVDVQGTPMVPLSDVVAAAFPALLLAGVVADFEASDGARPADFFHCVGLTPVDGAALAQGWIGPVWRNLAWESSLSFPSCMRLGDTVLIELADGPVE